MTRLEKLEQNIKNLQRDLKCCKREEVICLNTATPAFAPEDILNPTTDEVQAWVEANLTTCQQNGGTHISYFQPEYNEDTEINLEVTVDPLAETIITSFIVNGDELIVDPITVIDSDPLFVYTDELAVLFAAWLLLNPEVEATFDDTDLVNGNITITDIFSDLTITIGYTYDGDPLETTDTVLMTEAVGTCEDPLFVWVLSQDGNITRVEYFSEAFIVDRFNDNILGIDVYNPGLPLANWTAPAAPTLGNTVTVKFTDGTIVTYTYNGVAWVVDFTDEWFEERICLNTSTPTLVPANPSLPTHAEVQAWAIANLTIKQRQNGTNLVWFITGDGGDCDNPDYTWTLNKGSQLVSRNQNTIITIPNYTSLRTLTKYNHDIVNVADFTYIGPDGSSYTTLGGVFRKVSSGTENGGTIIVATDSTIWERQWDKIHVQPEWWECGGYSAAGTLYTSKNTSIAGLINGIYSDVDRINSAQLVGKIVLLQARVYEIDAPLKVKILHGVQGYYSNSASYGSQGSVIQDKVIANTTLTANYTAGATTFTVTDASDFRCGQYVAVTRNSDPFGGQGFNEAVNISWMMITNITSNVITVMWVTPTNKNASIGDKFGVIKNHVVSPNFEIKNILFDGQWDYEDYINYDWRISSYIGSANATNKDEIIDVLNIVEKCRFRNIPHEVFNTPHISISDCAFYNIGGGILHHGVENVNKNKNHIYITNIIADSVVLVPFEISMHEEAFVTFSNNSQNVFISNIRVTNLVGAVFGVSTKGGAATTNNEEDGNVFIDNCYFEGLYESHHTATPSNLITRKTTFNITDELGGVSEFNFSNRIIINSSTFVNTGDINILSSATEAVRKGRGPVNIDFTNCSFINVRINSYMATGIKVLGCKFYHKPDYLTFTDFTFSNNLQNQLRTGFLNFVYCDDVLVRDCYIEGHHEYNAFLDYGILFETFQLYRKDSGGTDTEIIYQSKQRAIDNVIIGCSYGIGFCARPGDNNTRFLSGQTGLILGSEVKGNKIFLEKNAANDNFANTVWGVQVFSGVEVNNNYIQYPETISGGLKVFGIVAYGIPDAKKSILQGSVIINNYIYSLSTTEHNIRQSHPYYATASFNNIVANNIITGDVETTAGHYLLNNIKVATTLTNLTAPYNIPDEIYLFKNKGVY